VDEKAGKYKYLYEMDTDIAYDWLRIWVDANCQEVSDGTQKGTGIQI
jgi:hypothetical protein